jgi:glycogen debranching enzyme
VSTGVGSQTSPVPPILLNRAQLRARTFCLGNEGGIVLYLPVAQNVPDVALQATKWFGASGFGRAYLEDNLVWIVRKGRRVKLDRTNQTGFSQDVDQATRTYEVDGREIRQTYFVGNRVDAVAMRVEVDGGAELAIQPELDLRYYQAFNAGVDGYQAEIINHGDGHAARVTNTIDGPSAEIPRLEFFLVLGTLDPQSEVALLPEDDRPRRKVYLKDERRMRLIERVYAETQQHSPDEAPIWDQYETTAYAPAEVRGGAPLTLIFAFGDHHGEALDAFDVMTRRLDDLVRQKRRSARGRLRRGELVTGDADVDRAHAHVLMRFNNCLVARDVKFHSPRREHAHFSAIFAGNKYFLDPWKRDENISLIGLLLTGDFETVRAILADTWRFQDERTGRLPHIIRLGEPLVYYSSDGTLWALERLIRYTRMSGDGSLLDEKYPMVERFFLASLTFVRRGLLPSGAIVDKDYLWETWMDTPYTPRDGYPVEIELLWLTVLEQYAPVVETRNPTLAARLRDVREEGQETFRLFSMDGYLADSLSYHWEPRDLLTPNGYMAFGLDYSLPPDLGRRMVLLGREQLAGHVGVRGLAPRDWPRVFPPEFLADERNVRGNDMVSVGIYNYHRGIEWLWLNHFFVMGELSFGDADAAYRHYIAGQVHAALRESGVGALGELYDAHGPLGADFQAWSMAGFIASLHALAGLDVDAGERRIELRPRLPADWPELTVAGRAGEARFDMRYRRDARAQRIEITPRDDRFGKHSLRLNLCLEEEGRGAEVRVHGKILPHDLWQIERDDKGRMEVGIDLEISGQTTVEVSHRRPT